MGEFFVEKEVISINAWYWDGVLGEFKTYFFEGKYFLLDCKVSMNFLIVYLVYFFRSYWIILSMFHLAEGIGDYALW